jgi:hypothetical protein
MGEFERIASIFIEEECNNCIDFLKWDNTISYALEEDITNAIWTKIIHGERKSDKELKKNVFTHTARIFEWVKMLAIPAQTKIKAQTYKCPDHMCKFDKTKPQKTMLVFLTDATAHFKRSSVNLAAGDALIFNSSKEVGLEALKTPIYMICAYVLHKRN